MYFAYFSKDGEAVESCPFSADLVHHIVLEQGIRIMDRITGYVLIAGHSGDLSSVSSLNSQYQTLKHFM
jgi:hypothetical protein